MAIKLPDITSKIKLDTSDLDAAAGRTASAGSTLTKTLTPAAAGIGLAFRQAWQEFDTGSDTIISKTGATGDALKSLEGSMKTVSKGVTTGMGDIGAVVGDLNTALGITGKPLETLTSQVVKLGELGESFDTMSFTRFMGDWSIASEDGAAALDRLYKTAQVTGIGVGELMEKTTQFGAPMRALGFDVDDSTALIAKFAKEGVNTEAVLAGMKQGLGRTAKAMGDMPALTAKAEAAQEKYNEAVEEHGKSSDEAEIAALKLTKAQDALAVGASKTIPEAFNKTVSAIKTAGSESEAFSIAIKAFGQRAGPDMARAVIEGRFEIEHLKDAVADSGGAINDTHKATLDWSDKLGMLKNQIFTVIGPVGEIGMAVAGVAAGLGPALIGIGKIGPAMAGMASSAASAVASVVVSFATMVAHAVAATAQFIAQAVIQGARWVWMGVTALASAAQVALAWLIALGPIALVVAAVVAAAALIVANWDWIKETVGNVVGAIGGFLSDLIGWVVNFVQEWGVLLLGPIGAMWKFRDEISGVVSAVIGFFGRLLSGAIDKLGELVGFVRGVPGQILSALGNVGSILWDAGWKIMMGLKDGIVAGLGAVKDFVVGIAGKIISWKGPLDYDKRMLVPAGQAIMDSLVVGLRDHEGQLARQLAHVTGLIQAVGLTDEQSAAVSGVRRVATAASASAATAAPVEQHFHIYPSADMDERDLGIIASREAAWVAGR